MSKFKVGDVVVAFKLDTTLRRKRKIIRIDKQYYYFDEKKSCSPTNERVKLSRDYVDSVYMKYEDSLKEFPERFV